MKTLLFISTIMVSAGFGQDAGKLGCGEVEIKHLSGPPSEYRPAPPRKSAKATKKIAPKNHNIHGEEASRRISTRQT
jgi:hypothetical protein